MLPGNQKISESHYTINVQLPNQKKRKYLTHYTTPPKSGAEGIFNGFYSALEYYNAKPSITGGNSDGTAENSGYKSGFWRRLELALQIRLLIVICILHYNV